MIVDIDGNELQQGDIILICHIKDYGWLARYQIIGETKTQFKLKRVGNQHLDEMKIEKTGCNQRALKC